MTSNQKGSISTGVGVTALAAASARAIETHREDALIDDPFAEEFVRAASLPNPMPTTPGELARLTSVEWVLKWRYMGVRTRFFDEFFERAWRAGIQQSVILAAGLDARAFRLHWPVGSRVFELEQAQVLEFKRTVLRTRGAAARCEHHMVAADLRVDWAAMLCEAGFDRKAPTAWLVEGLLPYLPPEPEAQLLQAINDLSAVGSHIAIEDAQKISQSVGEQVHNYAADRWGFDLRTLVHEGDRRDVLGALQALGWHAHGEAVAAAAERYERPLHPDKLHTVEACRFVTAVRG